MKHFSFLLIICMSLILGLFSLDSVAQFVDIPSDKITVDLGFAGDQGSTSNLVTGVLPWEWADGWVGLHALRVTADGKTHSEVFKGHVQGGVSGEKWSLQLFVDAERNLLKGSRLATQFGYFGRLLTVERNGWQFGGGLGNFFEVEEEAASLGIEAGRVNSVRWLGFGTFSYHEIDGLFRVTPDFGLVDFQSSVELTFRIEVDETFSVLLGTVIDFDSAPPTGVDRIQERHSVVGRATF